MILNLDEFFRASNLVNPNFKLLIIEQQHFVPVTKFKVKNNDLFLEGHGKTSDDKANMTIFEFKQKTAELPKNLNLRISNTHKLLFGFRIVNKSLVFY